MTVTRSRDNGVGSVVSSRGRDTDREDVKNEVKRGLSGRGDVGGRLSRCMIVNSVVAQIWVRQT